MPTTCSRCGSTHRVGHRFCVTCGTPVEAAPDTAVTRRIPGATGVPSAPAPDPSRFALPYAPAVPVPAPAPPVRRRHGRTLAVGAVVLTVLAAGGVGTALLLSGSDDEKAPAAVGASGLADGISVLDAPTQSWTLDASDIEPGSSLTSLQLQDGETVPNVLVFGNVGVVRVQSDQEPYGSTLAGIDTDTGEVIWRTSDGATTQCWAILDQTQLLCQGGRGEDDVLSAVDPRSGDLVAQAEIPFAVGAVLADSDTTYVLAWSNREPGADLVVAALAGQDLEARWTRELEASGEEPSPYVGLDRDGNDLRVDTQQGSWVVDTESGDLTESGSSVDIDDGYSYDTDLDQEPPVTEVRDADGDLVLTATGSTWGEGVVNGTLGIGNSLWDLDTATARWTADRYAGSDDYYWSWQDEGRLLFVEHTGGEVRTTTAVDPATGDDLWSTSPVIPYNTRFTDDAVISPDNETRTLVVRSRVTGDVRWSEDLSDLSDSSDISLVTVAVAPGSLIAVGVDSLRGFSDFTGTGGDADAPDEPVADGDDDTEPPTDEATDDGPTYVTDCGSAPDFSAVSSFASDGSLVVDVEVTATCPGGQWLSSSSTDISLSDDAGTVLASGLFDFSATPYFVPDAEGNGSGTGSSSVGDTSITLPLSFPADTVYTVPEEIADAIGSGAIRVACEQDSTGTTAEEPPSDPADGYDPGAGSAAEETGAEGGEERARLTLRRIAAEDFASVGDELVDHWIPQLSSKFYGLEADGTTYDYEAILAEHLDLRLRYDNVKLLYSDDWNFRRTRTWVTMTGVTYGHWRDVLGFCQGEGRVFGDCLAKYLRYGGTWEGTTAQIQDDGSIPDLDEGPTRDGRPR